jgi:hypothetical protein
MMNRGQRGNPFGAERGRKFIRLLRIAYGNQFGPVTFNLAGQLFEVTARGQRNDSKSLRQRLHNAKALPPN